MAPVVGSLVQAFRTMSRFGSKGENPRIAIHGRQGDRSPVLTRVGGPTLWHILTDPDALVSASAEPAELIKRDVLCNVREVLNARRGRCVGHPDYGMPDSAEFLVSPHGLARLAREIKQTIERWEPRLARPVQVRVLSGQDASTQGVFRATFTIRARLAAPWSEICVFRTTIVASGQAEVE